MIQWLSRDWGPKLISLILAIGLWYYAVGEESVEVTRTVPLEITLKNPQMSILRTSARAVQVTLTAPRALLSNLTSEEIRVNHEIGPDVKTIGDYSFRLEARELELPNPQIIVKEIYPEVIHVTLDELIAQKLVVSPNFMGEPAFGYKVVKEEIELNPNAVLVEGPKGQLEQLDAVKTERMDLVGRIRSFRRTVALELPPNVKTLSESLIDVYIPIREEFDEKSFENIPVRILESLGKSTEVTINPPAISFILKGSRRQLQALLPEKILAYIDVSSLENGSHEVPVELILPEDLSLKDKAAAVVHVAVTKK